MTGRAAASGAPRAPVSRGRASPHRPSAATGGSGWRAAVASSRRRTGAGCGALVTSSGSVSASRAISISASANASSVSSDSVSVGSMSIPSSTVSGKYTVGGWKPLSIRRLATSSVRTPVRFLSDADER